MLKTSPECYFKSIFVVPQIVSFMTIRTPVRHMSTQTDRRHTRFEWGSGKVKEERKSLVKSESSVTLETVVQEPSKSTESSCVTEHSWNTVASETLRIIITALLVLWIDRIFRHIVIKA